MDSRTENANCRGAAGEISALATGACGLIVGVGGADRTTCKSVSAGLTVMRGCVQKISGNAAAASGNSAGQRCELAGEAVGFTRKGAVS